MSNKPSRREVLQVLGATGVLAGVARTSRGLATAGFGVQAVEAMPVAGTTGAPAGKPRRGGRIRVAGLIASAADTLDPAKASSSTDYIRHYTLYNGLTRLRPDLSTELALAESLDTDDQRVWRIRLRRGVRFHDGRPLTSADVVFSLHRHTIAATGSKIKAIADQFESIESRGPLDLRLTLRAPNADLPSILAISHALIVPDGTVDFSRGIGTGAYRLRDFKPGVRTLMARNAEYWRDGLPWLDEIELIGIPDELSRVNALLSGDVHMAAALDPRSTRRVRESPGFALQVTKCGLYTSLILRQDQTPTSNPDLLRAFQYLFDRPTMQRALFRGYATLANDTPIPPDHPYYNAELPQREYDPERARFHLKRAGLLGIRLPVYASPAATQSVEMAAMLQQSAGMAGLNLAVNRVPSDSYWSSHWMKHPLSFGNTNPRPTADLLFSTLFQSSAPWNESAWRNLRFDSLLVAARAEGDERRRREMYGEMQRLVHEHCGLCIPVFMDIIDGHDRRLKGFGSLPIGGMRGYQFAEHVWWEG